MIKTEKIWAFLTLSLKLLLERTVTYRILRVRPKICENSSAVQFAGCPIHIHVHDVVRFDDTMLL